MQPYGDSRSRIAPKEARVAPRCTFDERGMLTQGMYKKTSAIVVMLLLAVAVPVGAAVSDAELTRNIQRQLSSLDYGSRRPVVAVTGGVVTLTGTCISPWLEEE